MDIKTPRIIELEVRNHPGVMSHITGLFSRRGFNLEGILCGPVGNGSTSRMYLLVSANDRTGQIITQLQKLYDVLEVTLHEDYDHSVFSRLDDIIRMI
jgi:acetolactate synthase-1/3 small subunit